MKAVILAGGSGTRLWPLSRQKIPKQFHKLVSGQSLFSDTIDRLKFLKPEDIFIATNKEYLPYIKKELGRIPLKNVLIEPAIRDTATCIGFAAAYLAKQFPNEVMAIIYSDHLIQNPKEFVKLEKIAEKVAREEETLNVIEVKAKFPNVHLGYVKIGKILREISGTPIHAFEKFTEKPDYATAKRFAESYKYLWNTGYYVWKISTILEKYKKHLPDTYRRLMTMQRAFGTANEQKVIAEEYPKCQKISIDYAIMEKVDPAEVRIIPGEFGWSDIGTWESIFSELARDERTNVVKAEHFGLGTEGSLIYGQNGKLIVTIGLKDIVVVDTPDALLIAEKGKTQEVKKIVEELKRRKKEKLL